MPIIKEPASSDSEMESLYSEEEVTDTEETSEGEEPKEVEGYTELVSKKLLLGKDAKVGDKVILTVVKDYGDEVELKYSTASSESKETMSEDEELDALSA
jgi:hypothetical protein